MRTESPEAALHLVRNTNAARSANMTIDFREISGRKNDLPAHAGHGFRDVCGGPPAFHPEAMPNLCDVAGILGTDVGFSPSVNAAVIVGDWRYVNPGLAAPTTGTIKLIGADVDQRVGVAVIGVL